MTPAHKSDRLNLPFMQEAALLVARIGLASLFLFSGCQKLTHLQGAAEHVPRSALARDSWGCARRERAP